MTIEVRNCDLKIVLFLSTIETHVLLLQVNEEHVGLVMEALSHRRAEIVDMGPVPGSVDRTRLSLTCPSRFSYHLNVNSSFCLIEPILFCHISNNYLFSI